MGNVFDTSFVAGEDLTGYGNRVVMLDGASIKKPVDADSVPAGILWNEPALGEAGKVDMMGLTRGVCGESIAVNDRLKALSVADGLPDEVGKLVVCGVDEIGHFRALSAGEKDEIIEVLAYGAGAK